MGRPLVSVIIPTYNRSGFLREALASVTGQSFFNEITDRQWELIVVDDGSTDATRTVVNSFTPPADYIYIPRSGVSAARNRGLSRARGEFTAFLDSDDLWKPEKIQYQMEHMQAHPDTMVCGTGEIWIRRGKFVNPRKKHRKYSGMIFDKVLPLCLLSLSSALFRSRLFQEIGTFDETLPACEDYDLGIRIASRYPMTYLEKPLIVKRGGHADQLSRRYWGMDRFRVQALEKALVSGLTERQKCLVKQQLHKKYQLLIDGAEKRSKHRRAEAYRRRRRYFVPEGEAV